MPKEGHTVVTIPKYVWLKVVEHYKKNEKELRAIGIMSPSKLVQVWILDQLEKE